jgi:hypothetical protein
MADLGISQSYFSCSKYPESDLVRITKVVVFSTMNPKKLVWNFSEFLWFSRNFTSFCQLCLLLKNQSYDQTLRTFQSLTHIPLYCAKLPGKTWGLAMPPLAVGAARLRPIPVSRRRSRRGKRLGSTRSSPRAQGWPWFVRRIADEGVPRRPRRLGVTARRMFC